MENPDIRVGDAERSAALEQLSQHFVNGALSPDEFEQRTGEAAAARTRGDVAKLFADLPELAAPRASAPATRHEAELEDMLARGRKVQTADAVIWSVATIVFFLGLFVFDWSYFWLAFVAGGIASVGVRAILNFSDSDEELFEELSEEEEKKRAERLRAAAERRRELGA